MLFRLKAPTVSSCQDITVKVGSCALVLFRLKVPGLILVFMTFIKRDTLSNIQKIERKQWMYIIGEVSLSIVNILLWYYLLQQTEAHKLTGSINPLSLVIITILSIFVYKKIISKKELVGILLVILGVLLLNSK